MHWLNHGLIHVIEISSSNVLLYRHGGEFSPFIGAKIVTGIMRFISDGIMKRPDTPGNIIGRGCGGELNEDYHVNLQTAIQKTKNVLEFCTRFGNGMSLPYSMDFGYLQHVWDAANIRLHDLMVVVDRPANQNNRRCPICFDPILSLKFGVPACGRPIHMRCWRLYRDQMYERNQVVLCPVCQFDTQGYCCRLRL
jgi:hypothetical protein